MTGGATRSVASRERPAGGVVLPVGPIPEQPPRVSVAVACYNYGRFLGDCLQSVVAQDGVDLEVVVVDDASTDDTAEVAAAFADADPRITVIRHERNHGHIATFNEGLAATTGDYVLKLDADDLLTPGALARAASFMETHSNVGLVYGRPRHFEGSAPDLQRGEATGWVVWAGRDWLAERCRRGYNCISNPEALVRGSLFRELGGYSPELPHTFDFEMWMRLAAVSDVARIEGVDQGMYRVHAESFQRTIHAGALVDVRGRCDAFEVVFGGVGAAVRGAPALHARARKAIAGQALDRACRAYDRGRTNEVPVDELVVFAQESWPEVRELPEWAALARRRRVGPRYAHLTPPFVARAAVRRLREERAHARWRRHGL